MYDKDMYNDYSNCNIPYSYPYSFEDQSFDYMADKNLPTYEMDYEDTVTIPFAIDKRYWNCEIQISIYNFRHEEIYWASKSVEHGIVKLRITYDMSSTILKPGMYYCKLQAVNYKNEVDDDMDVLTILPLQACSIHVK